MKPRKSALLAVAAVLMLGVIAPQALAVATENAADAQEAQIAVEAVDVEAATSLTSSETASTEALEANTAETSETTEVSDSTDLATEGEMLINENSAGREAVAENASASDGATEVASTNSLVEALLATKTLAEFDAVLEQASDDALYAISEAEWARVQAHEQSLLGAKAPAQALEIDNTVQESERVVVTKSYAWVAPFLGPVVGSK